MHSAIRFLAAFLTGMLAARAGEVEIQSCDSSGTVTFNEVTNATAYRVEWSSTFDRWSTFAEASAVLDSIPTLGEGVVTCRVPMAYRVIASTNWPVPAESCAFFTEDLLLPFTQSAQNLEEFLGAEHFEYDVDGWFFFGNLMEAGNETNPGVFFMYVQHTKRQMAPLPGWQTYVPVMEAVVGFNSAALGKYIYGNVISIAAEPYLTVTSRPWKVEVRDLSVTNTPLMTMALVSGTMGASGAVYRLTADIPDRSDTNGVPLQVDVRLRDRLGVVNQGYGTASFFPQILTQAQHTRIMQQFGGSVGAYLDATGDPMSCQGSRYYCLPLMDVTEFKVTQAGATLSEGTSGTLWMDDIVQSYSPAWSDIFSSLSWNFMGIRFPSNDLALIIFNATNHVTGSMPIARLFSSTSERTTNSARKAIHTWRLDEVTLGVERYWISPKTTQEYAVVQSVQLTGAHTANLMITMVRDDMEIEAENGPGLPTTITYGGDARVEGTLDGAPVSGWAFLELQPKGHL